MFYKTGDLQEIKVLDLPESEIEHDTNRKIQELKQATTQQSETIKPNKEEE